MPRFGGLSKRGLVGLAAGVTPVRGACNYASEVRSRRPLADVSCVRYVTDSEKDTFITWCGVV